MSVDSLLKEIQAFVNTVDDLYGLYLDATMGFAHNAQEIAKGQLSGSQQLGMSIDELDQREIYLGRGRPSDPDSILQHATPQGSYKARNTRGGRNFILMAQVVIILIFEYWETEHRGRIASAMGLANQSQLKIPILGDLRLLRNDVIHRKGFVSSRTEEKLKVLTGLSKGQPIEFDEIQVENLIRNIKAGVDSLVLEITGDDPRFRTFSHLV